jgi:transposase
MAESNECRNMAVPFIHYTIEEQRAVVRFLWERRAAKSAEIHRRMLAQYGARTMHQRKIYEWIERFKEGRTNVTDESRPGRPSTSHMDQHIQRVDALIREDRRRTLARVAQVRLAW